MFQKIQTKGLTRFNKDAHLKKEEIVRIAAGVEIEVANGITRRRQISPSIRNGMVWYPERVFTELLGRQLAIDFRPEESRSIMSSRVRLEADADIPLHPDGAILYRENSSRSVLPRPSYYIRRYIKITRRRASMV